MTSNQTGKNRYKITFGEKVLTLTTEKDNLFMEEVEHIAHEKYDDIMAELPDADPETVAILMAINTLSLQLEREAAYKALEEELAQLKENKGTQETKTETDEEA